MDTFVAYGDCLEGEPNWECWLADTADSGGCVCWPDELTPYEGSARIGLSCAESLVSDFACCFDTGDTCECYLDSARCSDYSADSQVATCPPPG